MSRRHPFLAAAATVGCILLVALPTAATPLDNTTVLASPLRILRLANDPWEGGVWIGTEGGLLFKDLSSGALRHYSIGDGLPHYAIYDLAVEPGRVWIGTGWGVVALDKNTQSMQMVTRTDGSELRIGARTVFSEGNTAWLGTDDRGLYRIDAASLQATQVSNPVNGSAFSHAIYGLGSVGPDLYISATDYGLVHWNRTTGESKLYEDAYLDRPSYGRIDVSPKEVWIGSRGEGVLRLDRTTDGMDQYASPTTVNSHAVYRPVKAFGSVWFPTISGVSTFDPAAGTWRYWHNVPGGENLNEIVLAQGELYGATEAANIVRYDRASGSWQAESWWTPNQVMTHNTAQSCSVEPDGRILFGTGGGGALLYDPVTASWTRLGTEPGAKDRPNDINIVDTATDSKTRFMAHYHGISEMDLATGEYVHYHVDGRGESDKRWGYDMVRGVEIDDEAAWAGVRTNHETNPTVWHPGKVTRIDRATHQLKIYGLEAGLSDGNVSTIALDGDQLWIGMLYGGLDVLDTKTEVIRHVYPASGQVGIGELLVRPDALWMTAGTDVVRLDRTTEAVTKVTSLADALPVSLVWAEDKLWVGTYHHGLYAVDPASMATTHYGAPGPLDRLIHCITASDGLLYLGTAWGVERFDLATHTFLPQVAVASSKGGSSGPLASSIQSWITIASPADGDDLRPGPLAVTGEAQAPAGSSVEVRLGDGPWTRATGTGSWQLTLDAAATGPTRLAARLLAPGRILAQDDIVIDVVSDGTAAATGSGEVSFSHAPLLEAWAGEPYTLSVQAPSGVSGTVHFVGVDGRRTSIPMSADGAGLSAALPAFTEAGEASYAIQLTWPGGGARLPEAFSDYGTAYPISVHALSAGAKPRIVEPDSPTVRAGSESTVQVVIQNPGSRPASLRVFVEGKGVTAPETIDVAGGSSTTLDLKVTVPLDQQASWREVKLTLRPLGTDDDLATTTLKLQVLDKDGNPPKAQGAPAASWVLVAALALAMAARRRR